MAPLGGCPDDGDGGDKDAGLDATVDVLPDLGAPDVPAVPDVPDTSLCKPGKRTCASLTVSAVCNEAGDGYSETTDCPEGTVCSILNGLCQIPFCPPGVTECVNIGSYHTCAEDGYGWSDPVACPPDQWCLDGRCGFCSAGTFECLSDQEYRECSEEDLVWNHGTCADNEICEGDACMLCDLQRECDTETSAHVWCAAEGVDWGYTEPCPVPMTCSDGHCSLCEPLTTECVGEFAFQQCTTDGLSWSAPIPCGQYEVCNDGSCVFYQCLPRVLFVIDRSGSMSSDWDEVLLAVSNIVGNNPNIRFGLTGFPNNGSCGVAALPEVPFAEDNGVDIVSWFGSNEPEGSTPLLEMVLSLRDNANAFFGGWAAAVVLLSDGEDTCAWDSNIVQQLGTTTLELAALHEISTYVIGYSYDSNPAELNAIAENGGTSFTEHIPAGNEAELNDVLGDIVADLKLCL